MPIYSKYQMIMKELEQKISNKEELEFVKNKLTELYIESLERITNISKIQESQNNRINKIENRIKIIEEDIYVDDEEDDDREINDSKLNEDYDFEITCPYCNNDFVIDDSYKNSKEIQCPNCKQIVELDWNDNENSNSVYFEEEDIIEMPSVAEEKDEYKQDNNNNDDDM